MSNKVKDNREEQRIERDAEAYCRNEDFSERMYDSNKNSYIAGATKEAARNKEDAIGFWKWLSFKMNDHEWREENGEKIPEQLYEIYINQKV